MSLIVPGSVSAAVDLPALLRVRCAPVVWIEASSAPGEHDRIYTTAPEAVTGILRETGASPTVEVVPVRSIPRQAGPLAPRPPLERRRPGSSYSATRHLLTLPPIATFNPGHLWVSLQQWDGRMWSTVGRTLAPRVADADRCPTVWWRELPEDVAIPTTDEGYRDRPAVYRVWPPDVVQGWYRLRVSLFSGGRDVDVTIATFRHT